MPQHDMNLHYFQTMACQCGQLMGLRTVDIVQPLTVGDQVMVIDPLSDHIRFSTVMSICCDHHVALVDLDNTSFMGCFDLQILLKLN